MGILINQYKEGDATRHPIHEIASKSTSWVAYRYRHHQISADTSATVTPESHDTLIAAAAYVTNAEARVDTVDDDDELTQRLDNDLLSDECYIGMPRLNQWLDDDSSSDDNSLSYQQEFAADTTNDSGATATVIINKVEHADKNNADPPGETTVGQITQDIDNATDGITTKEEVANMDVDVFAEFSGNKITTKEDIANMDDNVFAEYQRKRNDILDSNHGKLLDESCKLANSGLDFRKGW
jgi:hypothetical protein